MEQEMIMDRSRARVLNMKNLVAYQNHAVVSKEIVKSINGNVSLFAFERGEGLSEHVSPYDALVYLVEGRAEIRIEGRSHSIKEGELIIMPKNKPHSLKATENFKMMLVMIR